MAVRGWIKRTLWVCGGAAVAGMVLVGYVAWQLLKGHIHLGVWNSTDSPVRIQTLTYDGDTLWRDGRLAGRDKKYFNFLDPDRSPGISISLTRPNNPAPETYSFTPNYDEKGDCYVDVIIRERTAELTKCIYVP